MSLQGLRYPSGFDNGPVTREGLQLRVGLSYSLLDAYRALRLRAASDSACAAHQVQESLQQVLQADAERSHGEAFKAQADFLESKRVQIEEVVARARSRLTERVITMMEFNDLLDLTVDLERKVVRSRAQAARIDVATPAVKDSSRRSLLRELASTRDAYEAELSSARSLESWALRLQGGVIPLADRSVDWFGWVELSYSLGGILRNAAETQYRQARREELQSAPDELPIKLQRLDEQLAMEAQQAGAELHIVDKRLRYLRATQDELGVADAALVAHTRDALAIEELSAQADRVFLQTLIESLAKRSKQSG